MLSHARDHTQRVQSMKPRLVLRDQRYAMCSGLPKNTAPQALDCQNGEMTMVL